MITNVDALKVLYKKLGGSLTDYYSDIAGGIPVGDYDLISDCILACAKVITNALPAFTVSNAGEFLKVNAAGTGVEWADVPDELPAFDAEDAGGVLTVNAEGTAAEWVVPESPQT